MQLTDWPFVEAALLLIGLTHISFDKNQFWFDKNQLWRPEEEINRLFDCQLWDVQYYFNVSFLVIHPSPQHVQRVMATISYLYVFFVTRENREGWPLLTVETEANGDSWSTCEKIPSLVASLGSSRRCYRLLSCLGCSSQPCTKYFVPHRTLFHYIVPIHRPASWAGSRAASPVSYVSLIVTNTHKTLIPVREFVIKVKQN